MLGGGAVADDTKPTCRHKTVDHALSRLKIGLSFALQYLCELCTTVVVPI
jgi:hypothetical protein